MSKVNKNFDNMNKGRIELDDLSQVRKLIAQTESGIYNSTSETGEHVVVYMSQNKGMDVHFYQKNGWIRVDEYDRNGCKVSESFSGRYNKDELKSN